MQENADMSFDVFLQVRFMAGMMGAASLFVLDSAKV